MSRSQRGTPESASKVPRPYAGGRNDVMPFTAEELMLFKEAQSTASFAGAPLHGTFLCCLFCSAGVPALMGNEMLNTVNEYAHYQSAVRIE